MLRFSGRGGLGRRWRILDKGRVGRHERCISVIVSWLLSSLRTPGLLFLHLPRPSKRLRSGRLGELDAKRIHVDAVQEAGKALGEARQALVHDLEVHHVCLEVGHGVGELCKRRLEGVERK